MLKIIVREVVLLSGLVVAVAGCGSKEPAAAPKTETKAPDGGPVLVPPQQTAPDAKTGDQAALPTEGEPNAEAAKNAGVKTVNTSATAFPTEGDPTATTPYGASPPPGATAEEARIKANLASLSSEDRTLVEKQKICPVSGEALGGMGAPKKIKVAGHDVFICCASCEEPLVNEPAKYLAKVGLKPAQ